MKISEDHRYFQEIVSHPRVVKAVTEHPNVIPDLEPIWPWCVGVEFDGGGWIFQRLEGGYYEVHTLFLPKSRDIVENAKKALFYMFTATDALEIVTRVPTDLPHARKLAEAGGFRYRFTRPDGWMREQGLIPVDHFGLTIDEWTRDNPELIALGQEFHHKLGDHKDHGEDTTHDAYAGLGLACWSGGVVGKGLWRYNRWAVSSGYRPLEISEDGVEFDGVRLTMKDGQVNVENVSCQ